MELAGPVDHLPGVVLAPDDLDREPAELGDPASELRRMPVIVVTDLMLEEAALADRA